ncbi:MAG: winged helix-turn-helix transcriptional regulator [Candidatus Diapherotrites archaeon]|nr:winged helix-turn-helix transcriptional regulator [Candidatus Diapherotrites archaeon]
MDEPELMISSEDMKALSSDTRIDVLKLLNERKYTLAELSKKKNVSAPSMKQQLKILEENNLIHQIDEGRKWKYYDLTKKGRIFLNSKKKPMHISLILSASIFLLFVTGIVFYANTMLYSGMPLYATSLNRDAQQNAFISEPMLAGTEMKSSEMPRENTIIATEQDSAIPEPKNEEEYTQKSPDLSYLNINFIIAVLLSLIIGYYLRQKIAEERIR